MNNNDFYLRLGITGGCNLRCYFCNPNGDLKKDDDLSITEWKDILKAGREVGIQEVHYTGGEPTVREDLPEIIKYAKEIGYNEQSLTTNGVLLSGFIKKYRDSGLNRVNISLSTLIPSRYSYISGSCEKNLDRVTDSIIKSSKVFEKVKLNTVVLKNNFDELFDLIDFTQKNGVILRFLELQNYGVSFEDGYADFEENYVSKKEILDKLKIYGEIKETVAKGHNSAVKYYKVGDLKYPIGIIASHSEGYPCRRESCSRIRVTSIGLVSYCTHYTNKNKSLKDLNYQQKVSYLKELVALKKRMIETKSFPEQHILRFKLMRFSDMKG